MLADDIANDRMLANGYKGLDKVQGRVLMAQKFNLAPDFALAADGLVDNFKELERIAPFCRLPYRTCWFEFAQADRKHWMNAPMHYPGLQGAPHRVGFLCEAIDNDLAHWRTYLCWSLKHALPNGTTGNVSPMNVIYNTKRSVPDDLSACITFDMAPFDLGLSDDMLEQYMSTLGRSDWAGEIRYLFAVLGLLNARNVSETETVSYPNLNKQRAKKKLHPLSTHTVLKIRLTHKPSLIGHRNGIASANELRAHFVRGHFKTRGSTGIFWWGPHMRGNLKQGYVAKDYEIT